MTRVIYFSSVSENTKRFVDKLGVTAERLPLFNGDPPVHATEPYILVTPTYGGKDKWNSAVPKQVIRFLNDKHNRDLLVGVVSCGNLNFGREYCIAGDIIASKTGVPHLYRVELFGTPEDVEQVKELVQNI